MELRHLRYFKAVAEELHFGRAAIRLQMAQPPLSQQIQKLEAELGVLLFRRTKRHVELTSEGAAFLERTHLILKEADEAVTLMQRMKRGEIGQITIGFLASATYDVLPTILKNYKKKFPSIQITLKQLTSSEQMQALRENEIDFAIVSDYNPCNEFSHLVIRSEPLVLALPDTHKYAGTTPRTLSKFQDESFILTERMANPSYYDGVINSCLHARFNPRIVQETKEMTTTIALVSAGIGVSLVPASIQTLLSNAICYLPLINNDFETVTSLVFKPKQGMSHLMHDFIHLMETSIIPLFTPPS